MNSTQFAKAYSEYYTNTMQFLLSRGISPARAEEVAQAAWARGWERRDSLREASKIGAWVNTIALNLLRRKMRNGKREVELNPNLDSPTTTTTADRVDAEKMLGAVGGDDRKLLLMQVVEGCTSEEIGRACDMSAVAVRVRLCRAKARLRLKFGGTPKATSRPHPRKQRALPNASARRHGLRQSQAV